MKTQLLTAALCFASGVVLILVMGNSSSPDTARYDLVPAMLLDEGAIGKGLSNEGEKRPTCLLIDRQTGTVWDYKTVFYPSKDPNIHLGVQAFREVMWFKNSNEEKAYSIQYIADLANQRAGKEVTGPKEEQSKQ